VPAHSVLIDHRPVEKIVDERKGEGKIIRLVAPRVKIQEVLGDARGAVAAPTASLNHGHGGWTSVKSGVAYSATANATTRTSPGSFGITISYTPTGSQPALPGYAPITISRGGIVIT
jgi:hypothetical protein